MLIKNRELNFYFKQDVWWLNLSETIINTLITPAIFTFILSLVYFFLYKEEGQRYLILWSVAWFINALIYVFHFIAQLDNSLLWEVLRRFSVNIFVVFFILGSLNFCGKKSKNTLIFISALITLWYLAGLYLEFNFILLHAPINIVVGISFILTAIIYLTLPEAKQIGKTITAGSLFIIGINNSLLPFFVAVWMIPQAYIFPVTTVAKLGLTVGILLLYFERNKSNLNITQASYKVLAENTPDIIFRYNLHPNQQLEYINPAFTKATGYSCQELLSNPSLLMNILHPDYHHLVKELLTLQSDSGETLDFVAYHKNGQEVYFESHIVPQYRSGGQLISIEGIIRDVTQRKLMEKEIMALEEKQKKQTEMALCTAEDRFSKAFYNSPYPMAIISKDFTNVDVNYSFEESTGYHYIDLVSSDKLKEIFKDDKLNFKKLIEYGNRIRNLQFEFLNKSGENRTGLLSSEEIVFDGRQSILLVINDITDLKRMENEMSRLDRLNLIGQMAAGIGHEVRNPMTTVRGLLQILGNNKQYSELKERFDLMISELDRANLIITQFLSLSKNIPEELQPDSLNKILDNLQPLLQADALTQGKNIKFELEEMPNIDVNSNGIHQLILNLVRNGLEAMQKGGTVTIKTFIDGDEVVLSVKDEGSGIDSYILDKLGTPFLTTKEEGTGLGLATCYSIAERHNARVDVDSSPAGAVFSVRFKMVY
ncbi:MAG: PAS domain S-box protein [Firmicutes bacterium]|nr:PAS domain S-box protein [Bacillota bacterium]